MIWSVRRDHMGGDMTPIAWMPFIICGIYKCIIGMVLYLKARWKFDAAYKRGEESEAYECPKNFEQSHKRINAGAILKMSEDAFHQPSFIIEFIVSNNDKKYEMCSIIHQYVPAVKFWSHQKENLTRKCQWHPSF